ncbi:MAG: DUF1727 domain-containing protein [bacterium]
MNLNIKNNIEIIIYKLFKLILVVVLRRNGDVLPLYLLRKFDKNLVDNFAKDINAINIPVIIVTGTNGKTTAANLIASCLNNAGIRVCSNMNGANMINGIFGSILECYSLNGKFNADIIVIETDEKVFPYVISKINPDAIVITNFYRDQLDRYGEVNTTMLNIKKSIKSLKIYPVLILPSNEPLASFVGFDTKNKKLYFNFKSIKKLSNGSDNNDNADVSEVSINKNSSNIAFTDAVSCPQCGSILSTEFNDKYAIINYYCNSCGYKSNISDIEAEILEDDYLNFSFNNTEEFASKIKSDNISDKQNNINKSYYSNYSNNNDVAANDVNDKNNCSVHNISNYIIINNINKNFSFKPSIQGYYNIFNYMAAFLALKYYGLNDEIIKISFENYFTKFGRSFKKTFKGVECNVDLVKNPSGFNNVLGKIFEKNDYINALFAFSDRDADGRDISWIWDVNFEKYINKFNNIIITGLRPYDMAIRLKTAGINAEKIKVNYNTGKALYEIINISNNDLNNNNITDDKKLSRIYIFSTYTELSNLEKIIV